MYHKLLSFSSYFLYGYQCRIKKYFIYECNNARIYTNRIQDTAVIHKNIILSAQSFQLRNNNFSKNTLGIKRKKYIVTNKDNLSNNENVSSEENIVKVNNEKITFQEKK